ncbi:MAG: zinc-binding dehydrogenase, partial [Chloroflexota bacterium]
RDAARAEGLHGLGADEVIDDIENAAGDFHLILESVGGDSLATATRLVAPAGLIVTFGNSSHRPSSFDVSRFYGRNGARIQAFSLLASSQPDFRADLRFLAHEMANRRLDPQIGMETAWTEAARVLRALKAREVQGKAVLRVE